MKSIFLLIFITALCFQTFGQGASEQVMESRAKEMIRVISLNDKEQWKKFLRENCTEAFINKTMKAKVESSTSGETVAETNAADNLEAKAAMFARLHEDFGGGRITSIKTSGENVEMIVTDSGVTGTFKLKFGKVTPYLIEGLVIQAGN